MTSTKKTMMMVAVLVMIGVMSSTGDYNGEAESTCTLNNVSVSTSRFDPEDIEGIWYPTYYSHLPSYFAQLALTWYDYELDESDSSVIVGNSTVVYKNGVCASYVYDYKYNSSDPGKLTTEYKIYGSISVKHNLYVLGVNDSVLAAYSQVLINGAVSNDSSTVLLAVRNDTEQLVQLPSQLQTKLVEFCGETAGSLTFFKEKELNHTASCTA